MSPARIHLRFWLLLGLLGLVLLGGGWWCLQARGECLLAQGRLASKQTELESLRRQCSGAESPTLEQTVAELARAEETRRTLRAALGGEGTVAAAPGEGELPATRTEAFIDLSAFVGEFRERARVQGVTIRPGECFGFATYARTGPEPDLLPAVHRQSVVMRHLLQALLESRPTGIMAAQRERPRGHSLADPGAGYGAEAEDFFEMAPARSTATPGLAEVIALRLKFTGFTPVLRDFLNRLQQDSTPLVVRSVEAEPATNPALAEAGTAATRPRLAPQVMQFTVTVEHIRLLAEDPPAS